MAINDTINKYFNSVTTFQPAATVEIFILSLFNSSVGMNAGFTDGVNVAEKYLLYSQAGNQSVPKYIITNTDYFYVSATNASYGFSGIQIK
jgi:hypothetical protein